MAWPEVGCPPRAGGRAVRRPELLAGRLLGGEEPCPAAAVGDDAVHTQGGFDVLEVAQQRRPRARAIARPQVAAEDEQEAIDGRRRRQARRKGEVAHAHGFMAARREAPQGRAEARGILAREVGLVVPSREGGGPGNEPRDDQRPRALHGAVARRHRALAATSEKVGEVAGDDERRNESPQRQSHRIGAAAGSVAAPETQLAVLAVAPTVLAHGEEGDRARRSRGHEPAVNTELAHGFGAGLAAVARPQQEPQRSGTAAGAGDVDEPIAGGQQPFRHAVGLGAGRLEPLDTPDAGALTPRRWRAGDDGPGQAHDRRQTEQRRFPVAAIRVPHRPLLRRPPGYVAGRCLAFMAYGVTACQAARERQRRGYRPLFR